MATLQIGLAGFAKARTILSLIHVLVLLYVQSMRLYRQRTSMRQLGSLKKLEKLNGILKMRSEIFVFGSNLAGRHGKGAALFARQHYGAVYGVGEGRTGDAYAIPTKDGSLNVLPLRRIQKGVKGFLRYARAHPELSFKLTAIGCGLAGYRYEDIGPFFAGAPSNVIIPQEFKRFTKVEKRTCQQKRVRLSV